MIFKLFLSLIGLAFLSIAAASTDTSTESHVAAYFTTIQNDPQKLLVFLQDMPKGADLHNHRSAASYAENMIRYGRGDHLCIHPDTYAVYENENCPEENLLDNVPLNSTLYNAVIDSWSMRNFTSLHESAHDHFFSVFPKTDPIALRHNDDILAEIANLATEQNESYLELIVTPGGNTSAELGKKIGWKNDFALMRKMLLAQGLNQIVTNMQENITQIEKREKNILACGTLQAKPGCQTTVRYVCETFREQSPEQVFAQLLAAFEIVNKDSRFVGINLVQPEDGYISMRDYHLQMKMIEFLHQVYPNVHITLHAGELNSTLVPPDGLRFHIREAVEIAHAERIGHGVDIAFESDAEQLLKEMAQKQILVEINLSSNETILNIKDKDHPLPLYLSYHVPVAISTDDEGIVRTTLTLEYQKAILRYHLSYPTVKNLVRNSIHYSFLPGKSLWEDNNYQHIVTDCSTDIFDYKTLSHTCQQFLQSNEKAKMEWDLENRFLQFENKWNQ